LSNSTGSQRIHHVALAVDDTDAAVAFYGDVLGLRSIDRPGGARADGAWFAVGDAQIHLFQPGDAAVAPPHFAIEVADLAAAVAAIRGSGVTVYETEHRPGFGRQAMVVDPCGNLIELNQPDD
jgi:catechol 2,3-dioxygenase-like lactoylglutathione lyase family enzyme